MKRQQAKIIGSGIAAIALMVVLAGCAERRIARVGSDGRTYYSSSSDPTYYGDPTYYPARAVPAPAVPANTAPGYYVVPAYYPPTSAPGVYYVPAAPPPRYYDSAAQTPDERYYYRSPNDGRWYARSYDSDYYTQDREGK